MTDTEDQQSTDPPGPDPAGGEPGAIDATAVLDSITDADEPFLKQLEEWISGCLQHNVMTDEIADQLRQAIGDRRTELGQPAPVLLEHLTRLDLEPGDTFVAIAPTPSLHQVVAMRDHLREWMDEHRPGVHVLVFPQGTEVAVLSRGTQQDPPQGLPERTSRVMAAYYDEWLRSGIADPESTRQRLQQEMREGRW